MIEDGIQTFFTFIIIAGFGGVIGYAIGKGRGRANEGALLGALLGPIGWIVTLILSKEGPRCPECLEIVHARAKRCKHCGMEIAVPSWKHPPLTETFYLASGEKTEGPFYYTANQGFAGYGQDQSRDAVREARRYCMVQRRRRSTSLMMCLASPRLAASN
jgi:hypothetical protein